ncbi:MAG: DUF2807 domain-containing protein [Bacteroidales bacterium]|nr:DUF2807 domain-containing protein [Bacteroidales bacterium]
MKNTTFNIFSFLIFILFVSCKENSSPCLHSKGKTITKSYVLSEFYEVNFNGIFDVYWHNDNVYRLDITGGSNNIEHVEFKVVNNVLFVSDKNKCKWLRKYEKIRLDVYCPYLTKISLKRSNNFYCVDTITTKRIHIDNYNDITDIKLLVNTEEFSYSQHAGTGDTYISGKCNNCYIWSHGTGYVIADNLLANFCQVTHKTTGNIVVNVKEKLVAYLYKTGNLIVKGSPSEITTFMYSDGKVIFLNQ